MTLKVITKLLREPALQPHTLKHEVLECYALMATREKNNVEKGVQQATRLVNVHRNEVSVLLCLATGLMLQKQTPKARNHLKTISKIPYNADDSEAYERSWLLLSDIYIETSKYDLAQELCKRCLQV